MVLKKLYRTGENEIFEAQKIIQKLNSKTKIVDDIQLETCFYIELSDKSLVTNGIAKRLQGLLGDSWALNFGLTENSQFSNAKEISVIEIGPRLNYSTPWSTNCGNICKSAGIDEVTRIEKSTRYFLNFVTTISVKHKQEVIQSLYDPMTQEIYEVPLTHFTVQKDPENWYSVDVIGKGRSALEVANSSMGLAFDDWDLDYYTHLFKEKIRRNPTSVELFDLAQSNSEHSRHWFFKGKYKVNGQELPLSLLDMVIDTNDPLTTNSNNVIKFTDNSSGINGWLLPFVEAEDPKFCSQFHLNEKLRHIIFTAETHNFPTGVSPFSGAATGTGGRIRDVQAAGRGGHVIAGTAGYCFGNLLLSDYNMDWEDKTAPYPSNFATPLEIIIEASNGASDYGNKFGEPVICGFSRSFGMVVGTESENERREWIKPIMFSGGMGSLDDGMILKMPPAQSQLVVKVGGPVYRIGVGGGAASSVQVQGDNAAQRDLGAVQRGDAEMEQKLNRVIRGCLEMNTNPILAIHDQGAGGNANVLKELMEGSGGAVFTKAFSVGDETLSTLEIWGAEYQESNAILINPSSINDLITLSKRERCPIDKVGVITGDQKVKLYETDFLEEIPVTEKSESLAVNLELDWVLGKMPKKVFEWTTKAIPLKELYIPGDTTPIQALRKILRLPSVASKRFLTNKVDRSVTGLIAQQQCVGPLQTPLADVAVTALSYFSKRGAATSIGEQPIKILLDPVAGARVTVLEALTNLCSCLITDLKDVKCSANWMWPAKLPGEGYVLYKACESMCNVMKLLGIAIDGGKDSLSMAARVPEDADSSKPKVVKAPGSLVISAYAACPDVSKVITPDLKSPGYGTVGHLVMIKPALNKFRCGGSALAQVYQQIGSNCPDLDDYELMIFRESFKAIQKLIHDDLILSLHDISDGGVGTCLIEMAIAGWGGIKVSLPKESDNKVQVPLSLKELFNEEVGWILEITEKYMDRVMEIFKSYGIENVVHMIGNTTNPGPDSLIEFNRDEEPILSLTVYEAACMWEETSYQLEKYQMNKELAKEEFTSLKSRKHTEYVVNFKWRDYIYPNPKSVNPYCPDMAVLREEGSNGDREMVAAFIQAGFIVHDLTMSDLTEASIDLNQFRGIAFPGGFSYADVLGSGVGWAASIKEQKKIRESLENWKSKPTTFSLGICNGCQLMALLGWIGSGTNIGSTNIPTVKLSPNDSGRFESRWTRVKICNSKAVLMKDMEESVLGVWVAHGEGKFTYKLPDIKKGIEEKNCVCMQYVNDDNIPTERYPFNPNGSQDGVAGLVSECGRHLALMPHPERSTMSWQMPYPGQKRTFSSLSAPWSKLFQNAFDWCKADE